MYNIKQELDLAVSILKKYNVEKVILFGSVLIEDSSSANDIDIAEKGIEKSKFFQALGDLLLELSIPVDLIDLDQNNPFVEHILEEGKVIYERES